MLRCKSLRMTPGVIAAGLSLLLIGGCAPTDDPGPNATHPPLQASATPSPGGELPSLPVPGELFGAPVWKAQTTPRSRSVIVAGDRVVWYDHSVGAVVAVDSEGREVWRVAVAGDLDELIRLDQDVVAAVQSWDDSDPLSAPEPVTRATLITVSTGRTSVVQRPGKPDWLGGFAPGLVIEDISDQATTRTVVYADGGTWKVPPKHPRVLAVVGRRVVTASGTDGTGPAVAVDGQRVSLPGAKNSSVWIAGTDYRDLLLVGVRGPRAGVTDTRYSWVKLGAPALVTTTRCGPLVGWRDLPQFSPNGRYVVIGNLVMDTKADDSVTCVGDDGGRRPTVRLLAVTDEGVALGKTTAASGPGDPEWVTITPEGMTRTYPDAPGADTTLIGLLPGDRAVLRDVATGTLNTNPILVGGLRGNRNVRYDLR